MARYSSKTEADHQVWLSWLASTPRDVRVQLSDALKQFNLTDPGEFAAFTQFITSCIIEGVIPPLVADALLSWVQTASRHLNNAKATDSGRSTAAAINVLVNGNGVVETPARRPLPDYNVLDDIEGPLTADKLIAATKARRKKD